MSSDFVGKLPDELLKFASGQKIPIISEDGKKVGDAIVTRKSDHHENSTSLPPDFGPAGRACAVGVRAERPRVHGGLGEILSREERPQCRDNPAEECIAADPDRR